MVTISTEAVNKVTVPGDQFRLGKGQFLKELVDTASQGMEAYSLKSSKLNIKTGRSNAEMAVNIGY